MRHRSSSGWWLLRALSCDAEMELTPSCSVVLVGCHPSSEARKGKAGSKIRIASSFDPDERWQRHAENLGRAVPAFHRFITTRPSRSGLLWALTLSTHRIPQWNSYWGCCVHGWREVTSRNADGVRRQPSWKTVDTHQHVQVAI
ncbi:hypothetical protein DE146DRAFT_148152 [Phaeosphaeria sp. MPI-PUGE-AT-0046c]|nr:hypothetical protein DE146DRAFT_148152 [Phaeosphaeria sp. MPI-PUGE-AT-0046c]